MRHHGRRQLERWIADAVTNYSAPDGRWRSDQPQLSEIPSRADEAPILGLDLLVALGGLCRLGTLDDTLTVVFSARNLATFRRSSLPMLMLLVRMAEGGYLQSKPQSLPKAMALLAAIFTGINITMIDVLEYVRTLKAIDGPIRDMLDEFFESLRVEYPNYKQQLSTAPSLALDVATYADSKPLFAHVREQNPAARMHV